MFFRKIHAQTRLSSVCSRITSCANSPRPIQRSTQSPRPCLTTQARSIPPATTPTIHPTIHLAHSALIPTVRCPPQLPRLAPQLLRPPHRAPQQPARQAPPAAAGADRQAGPGRHRPKGWKGTGRHRPGRRAAAGRSAGTSGRLVSVVQGREWQV